MGGTDQDETAVDAGAPPQRDPVGCRVLRFSTDAFPEEKRIDRCTTTATTSSWGSAEARELAQQGGRRAARLAAVLRAIESRSADPGLNAVAMAAALGVTPRYIHLLLEETGRSFTHHLLEWRLEHAAALLRDPRWRERRIADIAAEAGFTDLSHFSRAFRCRYGATPSEVRAEAMREAMRRD
ncbi:MAG TPA: helix-turn-helix transcriptional regulator [Xanthobacteraceae bacterium]|nr:helix-turn-helix transcriptional regulator [Xanthobacteraceae bacterium]